MGNKRMLQYGGALFEGNCPKCGTILKAPKNLSVNLFMSAVNHGEIPVVLGNCRNHGKINVPFVRFEK